MPAYLIFFAACLALVIGYITYSRFVEKAFGADKSRITPALKSADFCRCGS